MLNLTKSRSSSSKIILSQGRMLLSIVWSHSLPRCHSTLSLSLQLMCVHNLDSSQVMNRDNNWLLNITQASKIQHFCQCILFCLHNFLTGVLWWSCCWPGYEWIRVVPPGHSTAVSACRVCGHHWSSVVDGGAGGGDTTLSLITSLCLQIIIKWSPRAWARPVTKSVPTVTTCSAQPAATVSRDWRFIIGYNYWQGNRATSQETQLYLAQHTN